MSLIPAFKIGWWNAWIFMSVFILQMLAIMFADKRIRQKSHVPMHLRQNNLERVAGIIGNVIWMLGMGYSVFLPLQIGTIWFYAGLPVYLVGLIAYAWVFAGFATTPPEKLITTGIYRYLRNPMHLSVIILLIGVGIAAASWVFLLLAVIYVTLPLLWLKAEERHCLKVYGDAYREYMSRTPRYIGLPKSGTK